MCRLERIFQRCDGKNQGHISLQELGRALRNGTDITLSDDALERIAELLRRESGDESLAPHTKSFSFVEFERAIRMFSMAELLTGEFKWHHLGNLGVAQRILLRYYCYNAHSFTPWRGRPSGLVCGAEEMAYFLFGEDPEARVPPASPDTSNGLRGSAPYASPALAPVPTPLELGRGAKSEAGGCAIPEDAPWFRASANDTDSVHVVLLNGDRSALQDGPDRVMLARLAVWRPMNQSRASVM